ncbi:hypothetical protein [Acidisphaera sp. L21]|uniref:hypothetical protein n=1 Tax=Acidisphaera sp. L21 TaxID=1641851 RepID=UPI00131D057A|nr:hypothetical protein [Acidisphaera sp. L21]
MSTPMPGSKVVNSRISIQFDQAKKINDRAALPGIDPAACYFGSYTVGMQGMKDGFHFDLIWPPGHPMARAQANVMRDFQEDLRRRQEAAFAPGDPRSGTVNIRGLVLKYNEAGEVFNLKGQVVGRLVCYSDNECQKYAY